MLRGELLLLGKLLGGRSRLLSGRVLLSGVLPSGRRILLRRGRLPPEGTGFGRRPIGGRRLMADGRRLGDRDRSEGDSLVRRGRLR